MDILINESIGFIIALTAIALFSYLETTIAAVRLYKLRELAQTSAKYHTVLTLIEREPARILSTILLVCNLSEVTAAALSTAIMQELFNRLHLSQGLGFSIGIGVAALALTIFGEIIPKNFAKLYGERYLGSTLWLINLLHYLLSPFSKFIAALSERVMKLKTGNKPPEATSENEIQFLIDYINQQGLMERDKSIMLQNIFHISNTHIKDILIPEPDMLTIEANTTIENALQLFIKYQFSRMPVYEKQAENIIGILYQKDIFTPMQQGEEKKLIKEVMRPVVFVPEHMKVSQILKFFKDQQLHMAIVLTEHGAIAGLVTLEDVLEEIVGEIKDEHELTSQRIKHLDDGSWVAAGSIGLAELQTTLNITFDTKHVLTLSGFLTEKLQHMPATGESVEYNGFIFQVQNISPRRILQVLIMRKQ